MKFVQDLKQDEREIKSLKERSRIIFFFISILFCIGLFKILQLSILDNTEYLDDSDKKNLSDRQIKVLEVYNHHHSVNGHKMQSIPVCKIPENLKN